MLNVFKSLNPIFYRKGQLIYKELDDVDMVLFLMKGSYRAGFVINQKEKLVIQHPSQEKKEEEHIDDVTSNLLDKGFIVGGFECSFNCRSQYLYRCHQTISGFFIN